MEFQQKLNLETKVGPGLCIVYYLKKHGAMALPS